MYELLSEAKKSITLKMSSAFAILGMGRLFMISLILVCAVGVCERSMSVSNAVIANVLQVTFIAENSLAITLAKVFIPALVAA